MSLFFATSEGSIAQPLPDEYYKTLDQEKLFQIQEMLIWTGDYAGLIDGFFGLGTIKAIQSYQKRSGLADDGRLVEDQLARLTMEGTRERERAGFQLVDEPVTGITIGIPSAFVSQQRETKRGVAYASPDDEIQIETVSIDDGSQTIQSLYERLSMKKNRKVTYSTFRDTWFVLSGSDRQAGDRSVLLFYARFEERTGRIRGFSVSYPDTRSRDMFRVITAMSNAFTPFKSGPSLDGGTTRITQTSTAAFDGSQPPPTGGEGFAIDAIVRSTASGFVVSNDGWIVTAASAVTGCDSVVVGVYGSASNIQVDHERGLAAVNLPDVNIFAPLGVAAREPELLTKVTSLGYLREDELGRSLIWTAGSVVSLAGRIGGSTFTQISGAIQPGNAGGPVLDGRGYVVGVLLDRQTALASLGSTEDSNQAVTYSVGREALVAFLDEKGIRATVRTGAGRSAKSLSEIMDEAEKALVPLTCLGN